MLEMTHYFFRTIEKICNRFHIIFLYPSKVGMKNVNLGQVADMGCVQIKEQILLKPEHLFLGPDFLKDEYTLLGVNIKNSPHYSFMEALYSGKDIFSTNYVRRWENGTLDWRRPMLANKAKTLWNRSFQKRMEEIQAGVLHSVIVYQVGARYYLYDGKHRAALYALLDKEIMCNVISESCVFSYYNQFLFKAVEKKRDYEKHSQFYFQRPKDLVK